LRLKCLGFEALFALEAQGPASVVVSGTVKVSENGLSSTTVSIANAVGAVTHTTIGGAPYLRINSLRVGARVRDSLCMAGAVVHLLRVLSCTPLGGALYAHRLLYYCERSVMWLAECDVLAQSMTHGDACGSCRV